MRNAAVKPVHTMSETQQPANDLNNALSQYVAMLLKWNKTLNLIGRSTVDDVWERHIDDSLQLLAHIPADAKNLVDFGSGAGLPAMVLALAGVPNVHMIESNYRKCAFLKEASRTLHAGATILHARIEEVDAFEADVITARAFASLTEIFAYAKPFLHEKTVMVLPKGETADREISEAEKKWKFEYEKVASTLAAKNGRGSILIINNVRPI
ncbi:MAG: 16S rRNA (guanine(527)-N(7))-methyltransferase RsmG [Proteobacteria bacterium]|nr:16S rRNA (guanine(527)-N(7))-methyltransferase RsmG [Pseudomonadota bacterium]